MFGKYRIISVLGAGSSSTVYLAKHLKLKVYRAIKCIPKDTAYSMCAANKSSVISKGSLLAEADLLKTLNHPGIPLIYDIDEDDDFIYMIEEFIQGDSLEDFILHQDYISQELIIEYGIQLCDILDYLHHITPYPILYQDLKPEHIIVCGNQIKLVDFGIASFITSSDKNLQRYGTAGFAAPEAYKEQTITPASDIYGLGKVLSLMADAASFCSSQLLHTIEQAASESVEQRYQTAAELKKALLDLREPISPIKRATDSVCQNSSHLISQIAVIGSRLGAGATHFSIALNSILNHSGRKCIYLPMDSSNTFLSMTESGIFWKETEGIFHYNNFAGVPYLGEGIESPIPPQSILVKDYGNCVEAFLQNPSCDLIFLIMSGSIWDYKDTLSVAKQFKSQENVVFICNYDNKKAAKKYARQLKKSVYCFPFDANPFHVTTKKQRLIMHILQRKEVHCHFRHWWKWDKISSDYWNHWLHSRHRCHTSRHHTGKSMWF